MNAFALFLALLAPPVSVHGLPERYVPPRPAPDAVIAKVNGEAIRAQDLESLVWQWTAQQAATEVVTHMLVRQDAVAQGVSVTDEQVEAALNERMEVARRQVPAGQTLEQVMRDSGLTRSRLFLRVKTDLLMEGVLTKSFSAANFVRVSTIIVPIENAQIEALGKAIRTAQGAYDRLKKGDKWDEVLAATTTNENVLQSKGLLGWRELSAFPVPVQEELKTIGVGEITKPAQTQNGIQLFRLEGRGANASAEEMGELRRMVLQGGRERYLSGLRSKARIEWTYNPQ